MQVVKQLSNHKKGQEWEPKGRADGEVAEAAGGEPETKDAAQ